MEMREWLHCQKDDKESREQKYKALHGQIAKTWRRRKQDREAHPSNLKTIMEDLGCRNSTPVGMLMEAPYNTTQPSYLHDPGLHFIVHVLSHLHRHVRGTIPEP